MLILRQQLFELLQTIPDCPVGVQHALNFVGIDAELMHEESLPADQELRQLHKLVLIGVANEKIVLRLQLIEYIYVPFQCGPYLRMPL